MVHLGTPGKCDDEQKSCTPFKSVAGKGGC